MTRTLPEAGLGGLGLEEEHERLRVVVPIRSHVLSTQEVEHQVSSGEHQVSSEEHQVVDGKHQVWVPPTAYSEDILRLLAGGSLSRLDVFTALGVHSDYRAYARHILPLVDRALIARTNPENPTASTQKYTLTKAGQAVLNALNENGS